MHRRVRLLAALVFVVVLAVLLSACGGQPSGNSMERGMAGAPAPMPAASPAPSAPAMDAAYAESGMGYGGKGGDVHLPAVDTSKIIRNAEIVVEVDKLDAVIAEVEDRVSAAGGYIQESHLSGREGGSRRATLVLRIPALAYGSFLSGLAELGDVTQRREWTENVTEEFIDLEARLGALREQEQRLQQLARDSASLEDLIRLESEIARVRSEIERIQGRLRYLNNRVDYSTVRVELYQPPPGQAVRTLGLGTRAGEAFTQSVRDLIRFSEELVVLGARVLPSLVYLGVFGVILAMVIRGVRNRRRAKSGPPAPPSA